MTFSQAFVYLLAAVISVPLAKRLGLGSVLGYLFAGVVIGPFCFGLVETEGQDVMHVAEFGVVMMLFVIGLELRPAILWHMRGPILGLGGAQVLGTAAAVSGLALLLRVPWQIATAVGFFDRDCAAVAERKKPDEDCRRQGVVCGPFVSGHRCSSDSRVVPAACDGKANRG
jgi:Kef-type K+ transport system membrane component KefB